MLKDILITAITKHSKNLPNNLFNQLIQQQKEQASASNSYQDSTRIHQNFESTEAMANKSFEFSLITTNEDIEVYICRFLSIIDLPHLSQTCRHLCILSL